jgi:hypothetical protein
LVEVTMIDDTVTVEVGPFAPTLLQKERVESERDVTMSGSPNRCEECRRSLSRPSRLL